MEAQENLPQVNQNQSQEPIEKPKRIGEPISLRELVRLGGRHRKTAQVKTTYYPETVYYIPHHLDSDGNIRPYLDEKGEPVTTWVPFVLAGQPVSPQQAKKAAEYYKMFKPENDKIRRKMEQDFLKKNKLRELPYAGCPWRVQAIVPLDVKPLIDGQ